MRSFIPQKGTYREFGTLVGLRPYKALADVPGVVMIEPDTYSSPGVCVSVVFAAAIAVYYEKLVLLLLLRHFKQCM